MPELLNDSYGRRINYLRLSVTDRCNLRCVYCMTENMHFLPRKEVLEFDEILGIVSAFVKLGVRKIRITGGEPLVRPNLVSLIRSMSDMPGLDCIALSTNGVILDKYAEPLKQAGVQLLNISLDTLDSAKFRRITRLGNLNQVLAGIDAAVAAGFRRIKINSVILRHYNADEILPLVDFARRKKIDISFIEEMPLGPITAYSRSKSYYSSDEVRKTIEQQYPLTPTELSTGGPSRYYAMTDSDSRVGFISPHSNNFCASCNRVRLTAEGRLLLCLGNEHSVDLRGVVRAPRFDPMNTTPLVRVIENAMPLKPWRHHFEVSNDQTQILRLMNVTGG